MGYSNKQSIGFSILEIIVTIVIVSVLSVSVFYFLPIYNINLPAQASTIAGDIRLTQTLSMTNAQRYRFVKLTSTTYQITNSAGVAIKNPATGKTTTTLGKGITFSTITNLPNNLIAFDSNGVPYTDTANPGTALSATATITITGGGLTNSIQISPQTGWVNVI